MFNLDEYITDNLDNIIDEPEKYIGNYKNKKKVLFDDSKNNIIEIDKSIKYTNDNHDYYDDIDEKEYFEYNYEYFDNSNQYFDIYCDHEEYINDYYNYEEQIIKNEDETKYEDDYEDDIIDELYEKMHKSLEQKKNEFINDNVFENLNNQDFNELTDKIDALTKTNNLHKESLENDNGYYFFHLMNIFMKYYNNKFDKKEHFFSNIKDVDIGTTNQMELFFDAIVEFKMLCEQMEISSEDAMKQLYSESEPEKISKMFEKWDKQIYMFEHDKIKLFSPSLIICLNYIFEKNILNDDWNIYNLRDN